MDERQAVLQGRRRHLLVEIEQLRLDVEHWNRIHPDEEPIDWDPEGTMRQMYEDLQRGLMPD